jgi:hypothetical protein
MIYPAQVIIRTHSREFGGIKMRCPNPTTSIRDRERKPNVRMGFALHYRLRNRINSGADRNIEISLSTISHPSALAKNKCTLSICSDVL